MHIKKLVFANSMPAAHIHRESIPVMHHNKLIQNGIEGQIYCKYIYNSISIKKILKELKCNYITQNVCAIVMYFGVSHCSSHISCAFIAELKIVF